MKSYLEPAREIPVVKHVDVLVCGGGPAGIAAALGAARNGADTMLLELTATPGGMITSGMMSHWTGGTDCPVLEELISRCDAMGDWGPEKHDPAIRLRINHEKYRSAIQETLLDAGVDIQLHTLAAAPMMTGELRVGGVITESKSGREAISAGIVVDCSGDGDIAARAGAEFVKGREQDSLMPPVTTMFKIAGVDEERSIHPGGFESRIAVPLGEIQELGHRELPRPAGHVLLYPSPVKGQVVVNMTNMTGIDGTDARDLTRAEIACRQQIPLIIEFLRKYAPGYENCHIIAAAATVGVRETRHFKGLYSLTPEDIVEARVFDDWIATRNFFNFDIHNLKGPGLDPDGAQAHFRSKGKYTIPLRCCVPEKIDGLLLAGRCISGTHKAHSNFRVMPICANIGLGVGTAAALAVSQNIQPRDLKAGDVQQRLIAMGVGQP